MKSIQEGISDEELFRRSKAGDRLAFEHLYDRYFGKLVWFASGFLKDEEQAKDLVQDVFIKIVERPELFDLSKRFSTWIYTITGNQCRNRIRDESNRLKILSQDFAGERHREDEDRFDKNVIGRKLAEAIAQLNEKERTIYQLRFEEEMSIREISVIISIPEGSVKSGIFHLLKKISKQLKGYHHAK